MFKLGLDVHGVIDSIPESFKFLSDAIVKSGGEVHIITGGSWTKELKEELNSYGIVWTHHFSVYDYLIEKNTPTTGEYEFPDGTIQKKFVDGYWDKVKAEYCKKNQISLHLDDTLIYNEHFETPFARVWTHNGKNKSPKKDRRHLD
jgi:hypothetical protein